jgi:hypothetical protein
MQDGFEEGVDEEALKRVRNGRTMLGIALAAVVAIPSRDVCAFCDAGNAKGLEALRRIADRITGDPANPKSHLVTPTLLARKDGVWRPYAPEKKADLPPLEFR